MKDILKGQELKNYLKDNNINEIVYHTYNMGEIEAKITSLVDEKLYKLYSEENNKLPIVIEAKIFNSAKEIIEFRKYINKMSDEEAVNKTIVWEVATGTTLKELIAKSPKHTIWNYYEELHSDEAIDIEQINDNEHYITIDDNIYGYSK